MSVTLGIDFEFQQLASLAPAGYLVALHIRFTTPLIARHSYDPAWIERYSERGYLMTDPATLWAFGNTGSIRWSDLADSDPTGVLVEARNFGLVYGATCSHGPLRSRSIGSFARGDREFTEVEIAKLHDTMLRLHELTAPAEDLTEAQIIALRCIANGDRHAAAAEKLGISESALKARIFGARVKLGARTTAEAIRRAKDFRLL
ncbi:LuxR family transcriptional regulator [Cereibacter changlensis]|uniref:LuxR family transcriptional regulator n=1 Tax=Cereibacter changlensis TaxID=402884 RepID=A0A4U0Z5E2_9RHOB|nr:autoinducer binding domain-containing protein [Cereibacter changlensis]TKA98506.1 LuxR family transcriptional regulator [Cereibacter changlensis]